MISLLLGLGAVLLEKTVTMNRKQKICLWLGIIVIVLMGLFPPWLVEQRHIEWWSIFAPPSYLRHAYPYDLLDEVAGKPQPRYERSRLAAQIATDYLFAQWVMVAAITGGLIITFQEKKRKGT